VPANRGKSGKKGGPKSGKKGGPNPKAGKKGGKGASALDPLGPDYRVGDEGAAPEPKKSVKKGQDTPVDG
jgi:hypothetical protein